MKPISIGEHHEKHFYHNQPITGINRFDDAIIASRRALAIYPYNLCVIKKLMFMYWFLNDLETANFWFERYLKIQKDPLTWFLIKMWHAYLLGDQEARAYLAEPEVENVGPIATDLSVFEIRGVTKQ